MPGGKNPIDHLQIASRRNWVTMLGLAMGSAGLTLLIFLVMPLLNTPAMNSSKTSLANLLEEVEPIREISEAKPEIDKTPKRSESRPDETKDYNPEETSLLRPVKKPDLAKNKPEIPLPLSIEIDIPQPANTSLSLSPLCTLSTDRFLSGVFSEGQLDCPLTALVRMAPVYPVQARRLGTEGWVKVLLTVDEEGNVTETVIIDADPAGVFEKSVKRCISRWRFQPGTVGGTPVKARIETTIEFKLAAG